jgi:hypothetical protein
MPEARPVYGGVGADRPEAQTFVEEADGILVYVCPKCRKELEKTDASGVGDHRRSPPEARDVP